MKLKRYKKEIIKPIPDHQWESGAAFNPAAIKDGDIVHLLYRAVESPNFSTIGYAKLSLDGQVLERCPEPVIVREYEYEKQGVEDPRISNIDGINYILYSAYDGRNVRITLTETEDFKTYKKFGKVGPDLWDKDAMLFSEKVNGKIVFVHRIEPNIQFAYFEDIEHMKRPEKTYWKNHIDNLEQNTVLKSEYWWENLKVGGGAPPVKTDEGWIFVYHGVDKKKVYRAGIALLDIDHPEKTIARFPEPVLEPETDYEKVGDVNNVVFPSGNIIFNDVLYIYYGGADKVVCIAYIELDELLHEIKKYKL